MIPINPRLPKGQKLMVFFNLSFLWSGVVYNSPTPVTEDACTTLAGEAGEMALWGRVLATQVRKSEFGFPDPT